MKVITKLRDRRLHYEALDQVLELAVLLNEDMTEALARDGLTVARAPVVWHLYHSGPCTQRALANALGVTPRNITGLVDGLAATGFVSRQPHPTDRRATLVTLTDHGRQTAARLTAERDELAALLFAEMSDTEFDGFVAGLGVVLDRIRAELARTRGARQ